VSDSDEVDDFGLGSILSDKQKELLQIADYPTESVATEIKGWIDPSSAHGCSKVIKAVAALANTGGGKLVVGVAKDGNLDAGNLPPDWKALFDADSVQLKISQFISTDCVVEIVHVDHGGKQLVGIFVEPCGQYPFVLSKPVVASVNGKNKELVKANTVFVRTLSSNGTYSSSEAKAGDLVKLLDRCFEAREADIARFIKRHLSDSDILKQSGCKLIEPASGATPPSTDFTTTTKDFMKTSLTALEDVLVTPRKGFAERFGISFLGAREVSCAILNAPESDYSNVAFRDRVLSSNPRLTGWPLWLDTRHRSEREQAPRLINGGWQALLMRKSEDAWFNHFDFWRISRPGLFYHFRGLEDDLNAEFRNFEPGTKLDFGLAVLRAAEAIYLTRHFSRNLYEEAELELQITFRWSGLMERELSSWANRDRYIGDGRFCYTDAVESKLTFSSGVTDDMIWALTQTACDNLFEHFDGFQLSPKVYEDLVTRLITRRL
tara:strand:+ start:190 stop:1665 length:1476 start_codon:yes stop_codon:yes gene_type:complete